MLDKEGRVAMADVTGVQVEDHFDLENGGGGTFIILISQLYCYMLFASIDPKDIKGVGGGEEGLNPLKKESSEFKIYLLMWTNSVSFRILNQPMFFLLRKNMQLVVIY